MTKGDFTWPVYVDQRRSGTYRMEMSRYLFLQYATVALASHAHTTFAKLHWQTALIMASLQLPVLLTISESLSRRTGIEYELVSDHAEHL